MKQFVRQIVRQRRRTTSKTAGRDSCEMQSAARTYKRRRRFRCWRALLEQVAGAEGIVVAGAATPPHGPSETEFEGHAAALLGPPSRCGQSSWWPWSQDLVGRCSASRR